VDLGDDRSGVAVGGHQTPQALDELLEGRGSATLQDEGRKGRAEVMSKFGIPRVPLPAAERAPTTLHFAAGGPRGDERPGHQHSIDA
jgi:hypothetical protein